MYNISLGFVSMLKNLQKTKETNFSLVLANSNIVRWQILGFKKKNNLFLLTVSSASFLVGVKRIPSMLRIFDTYSYGYDHDWLLVATQKEF